MHYILHSFLDKDITCFILVEINVSAALSILGSVILESPSLLLKLS